MTKKQTSEVFGISNSILPDSYVDRGKLDSEIQIYLSRKTHIALRGESKCGKSWLRQKNIPNALTIQCRFGKNVNDIYTDALSQLGISFTIDEKDSSKIKGHVEAQTSFGNSLLAKLLVKTQLGSELEMSQSSKPIGQDINDLRFIAQIIVESGKRLVIEDFHYLSNEERQKFAFDLKALWDYGCFVVIIGVWSQSNMLIWLNRDLTARIHEISIYWSQSDLMNVINKGSKALRLKFSQNILNNMLSNCFGNVGILQKIILMTLDEANILEEQYIITPIDNQDFFESAAMKYAEQLNPFYQQFAKRVSSGIRIRKDSTGIYAHAMGVIVEADDKKLINGLSLNEIFQITHERQPRIQKNNLRVILQKLEELQVDEDGRGLVIAYNEPTEEITAVDRQLLFYRNYLTVKWPWEDLIRECEETSE